MEALETVDMVGRAHKAQAHAFYSRLRETQPVCQAVLPTKERAWLVARYADVSALLKDRRFAKDPANAMTADQLMRMPKPPRLFAPLTRNMLGMDDPDHARLRKLVQAGFTPKRIESLAGRTEEIAQRLLDNLEGKSRFDLMARFALPLPVTVISELLGVPERDRARFAKWSHTLLSAPRGSWRILFSLPDMLQFLRYLRRLVAMKRAEPGDDLVSALVEIEAEGERLSEEELRAMIAILLSAGHETTTNLIGNGTLALLQHPEAMAQLRAQAQSGTAMETAVEELLRYASPVETSTLRYAREEVEISGTRIPPGGVVLGIIASANRDERQFPNGASLDLSRTPNRHLSFGEGGHYCLGAALARMEGRVAFQALLRRMPALRLDEPVDTLRWASGIGIARIGASAAQEGLACRFPRTVLVDRPRGRS